MGICLGVTSGKGGTGKSTVSSGLAISFSAMGKSVLMVDLDEGLRCLDTLLGAEDIVYDLSDALSGTEIEDTVYQIPEYENIHLIAAPCTVGNISYTTLKAFAKKVKKLYDVVIFDFPAGIDLSFYPALGKDTQIIAVCNMDPVSIRDASIINRDLPSFSRKPRIIVNKFNVDFIKDGIFDNIDALINQSGIRLLGLVPNDIELMMLSVTHKIDQHSRPYKAFMRIARRILGEDVNLPKFKKI